MHHFTSLTPVDWGCWTLAVLQGQSTEPPLEPSREPDVRLRLIGFAKELKPEVKSRFAEGLVLALEATQPRRENSQLLCYLLHLISYFTPVTGKPVVRQLMFSNTLWRWTIDSRGVPLNLQSVVLSVCGAYGVDDALGDYIERSFQKAQDFQFYLIGLRFLSRLHERVAVETIEPAVSAIESQRHADSLIREIQKQTSRYSYSAVMRWYRENRDRVRKPIDANWELFSLAWRNLMPKWDATKKFQDFSLELLALLTFINEARISIDYLIRLAEYYRKTRSSLVAFALAVLLRESPNRIIYLDPQSIAFSRAFKQPQEETGLLRVEGDQKGTVAVPLRLKAVFDAADAYLI